MSHPIILLRKLGRDRLYTASRPMVFTTNTIAFAEEVAVDAVDDTAEAEEAVVTLDADEDAVAVLDTASDVNTISSDVMGWFIEDDRALMQPYFKYSGVTEAVAEDKFLTVPSEHYVNGEKIAISTNQKVAWKTEGGYWEAYDRMGVSSNVFNLNNTGYYLIVTYSVGGSTQNRDGSNKPLVYFNGKKWVPTEDPDNGKIPKENYASIWATAALVKQEAGKAPILIANSMSANSKGKDIISIKISPKNNQYANVSMNAGKNGHEAIENPYLKGGKYPYFTISVKLNGDKGDNDIATAKKNLGKAVDQYGVGIKKSEFKFDIARNYFAKAAFNTISAGQFDGEEHTTFSTREGFRHAFGDENNSFWDDANDGGDGELMAGSTGGEKNYWIGERNLTLNYDWNNERNGDSGVSIGVIDLFTTAKKAGKNNIPVYIVNGAGENAYNITSTGWTKKGNFTTYKLKKGKDYETTVLTDESKALVLKPIGNFEGDGVMFRNAEYTVPAGYYYNGETLKKELKVTELRMGIYGLGTSGANPDNKDKYYIDSDEN